MLDRQVVKGFLEDNLKDWTAKQPEHIDFNDLVETFCLYVENDYYEWLKENLRSFFCVSSGEINWGDITGKIEMYRNK